MNATQATAALNTALAAYAGDTGPGYWTVSTATTKGGVAGPCLTYVADQDCDVTDPDQPWKVWGGEAIIEAAGLVIADGIDDNDGSTYYASAIVEAMEDAYIVQADAPARCPLLDQAGSLEQAADLVTEGTAMFTSEHLAGQYAFVAAKEAGCGFDANTLEAHLDILADAGGEFSFMPALQVALAFASSESAS